MVHTNGMFNHLPFGINLRVKVLVTGLKVFKLLHMTVCALGEIRPLIFLEIVNIGNIPNLKNTEKHLGSFSYRR